MDYSEIIDKIPEAEKPEILRLLRALDEARRVEASRETYLPFVKEMWPGFIDGRHHKIMADAFERVVNGSLKRLIINMPPRHTKSEFASYLLPAWFLGKNPGKKVIQTAHTAELAVGFGRKVRNLVGSDDYQKVFPGVSLQSDSKAAGRWSTNKGGEYFAIGVGGAVTGKGADLLIIDDPHSEQEAMVGQFDVSVYDKVFEWYSSGPRQRLQPGGAIVIVMTRWAKRDLTGQIISASARNEGSSEWEVIVKIRNHISSNGVEVTLLHHFSQIVAMLKVTHALKFGVTKINGNATLIVGGHGGAEILTGNVYVNRGCFRRYGDVRFHESAF